MVLLTLPALGMHTPSPIRQQGRQGRALNYLLTTVHRSRVGQECRRILPVPHTQPRRTTCVPSVLWFSRYEQGHLRDIVQFVHSRQVFTGQPPFFGLSEIARTYSMLNGSRPSRPDCCEVSDLVWRVIEGCWNPDASRRMEIEEVVTLLEELSRILSPRVQRTCWKVKPQTSNR